MRWIARALLALGALVALLALGVWLVLRPPAPLAWPEPGAVLAGVTLIEPGVSRREAMRLVVESGRIAEVGPAADSGDSPYDGTYVLPGLTDMHVHFPPDALGGQVELFALLHLMHGVTTARDAGDVDGSSSDPAREGIAEKRFPGPRLFGCGPFLDGDPPLWGNSLVARTPEEGRAAVTEIARRGYECVKVYDGLAVETVRAVRDEAHANGLTAIGHVPRSVPYEEALLDDAQHLIGVAPPDPDPELRFPFVLRAWLELSDARLRRLIAIDRKHGLAHTPTLVTVDRVLAQDDFEAARAEPDVQLLPRFYRDVIWHPDQGMTDGTEMDAADFEMVRRAQEIQFRTIKRMHDAGVPLHTGTDTLIPFVVPGASLHRELRLFQRAGLTPAEVLALSTRVSPRFLGIEGAGELRPGAPAELVIFAEDPTRDLAALDSIVAVVRDGHLFPSELLESQLARYREHHEGALYDTLVTALARRLVASIVGDDEAEAATKADAPAPPADPAPSDR